MISVLIPTYNYNTFQLVKEIHKQLVQSQIAFEIICVDDASLSEFNNNNRLINNLDFSKFEILDQNIGRSKIRNLLASYAKYNWLLFLDADVFPVSKNFIAKYINTISEDMDVICGGIKYCEGKPDNNKVLRWLYGKNREEKPLSERLLKPYHHFFSANFMIQKSILKKIKFNVNLIKYGHEDTLFAFDLRKNKFNVNHIDNSVFHLGIDTNDAFIKKTKESVENIFNLYQKSLINKKDIRLITKFSQLKTLRLSNFYAFIFMLFNKAISRNLQSKTPSLLLFDFYKLGYLCSISK